MHMALSIHEINVDKGGKKLNKLGGRVIQGEIFCFKMKHASLCYLWSLRGDTGGHRRSWSCSELTK